MPSSNSFLVLIGSFARGDFNQRSDIDFVQIGRPKVTDLLVGLPRNRKVNLINYSIGRFRELYRNGDLFIHHVLTEGKLRAGDSEAWDHLRHEFRVKRSFRHDIKKNQKAISFLLSDPENLEAPIAFLANFLRALKQIAIFRLAEQGQYVFVKKAAITQVFPWVPDRLLQGMLTAEYIVTRKGLGDSSSEDFHALTACAGELFKIGNANREALL